MKAVRRGIRFLSTRLRTGLVRARRSIVPALQMTLAGVGAYTFAEQVLGHEAPIFAAVAAMISLGFSKEPQLRRTAEIGLGCTLGILIGDTMLYFFGSSIATALGVVFISIMLARILDPGATLAMQMGLQALLVVMLPPPDGGPFVRSGDALIGCAVAMAITVITPKDPRREPVRELKNITYDLITALRDTAEAVRSADSRPAWHALIRCRGLQSSIDEVTLSVRSARELTRFSPASRRHRDDVKSMSTVINYLDLAVRSMRIVTRRTVSMLDHGALSETGGEKLSAVLEEVADGTLLLQRAVVEAKGGRSTQMRSARQTLATTAGRLHPEQLDTAGFEGETVVLLLRTLVTDLLKSTGLEHDEAEAYMPELG